MNKNGKAGSMSLLVGLIVAVVLVVIYFSLAGTGVDKFSKATGNCPFECFDAEDSDVLNTHVMQKATAQDGSKNIDDYYCNQDHYITYSQYSCVKGPGALGKIFGSEEEKKVILCCKPLDNG